MWTIKILGGVNLLFAVLLLVVAIVAISRELPTPPLDPYSEEEVEVLIIAIYDSQDTEAIREMLVMEDRLARALKSCSELVTTLSVVSALIFLLNGVWIWTSRRSER